MACYSAHMGKVYELIRALVQGQLFTFLPRRLFPRGMCERKHAKFGQSNETILLYMVHQPDGL